MTSRTTGGTLPPEAGGRCAGALGERKNMKPDTTKMWHFTAGGRQRGPVQFDELVRLANLGVIDRMRDKVWCEGMANWTPIMQVDGIDSAEKPPV